MIRHFFKRLSLTIVLSIGVYAILSALDFLLRERVGGIFTDLQPEAIGIVFTIGFVDWLIKMSELREWVSVKARAMLRVRDTYRKSGTAIRYSGPLYDDLLRELYRTDPHIVKKGWENYQVTDIFMQRYKIMGNKERWKGATPNYWMSLGNTLTDAVDTAEQAINLYGKNLEPELQTLLDEVATVCGRIGSQCNILAMKETDDLDLGMMEIEFEVLSIEHRKLGKYIERLNAH